MNVCRDINDTHLPDLLAVTNHLYLDKHSLNSNL